jgi:hypothetical protein
VSEGTAIISPEQWYWEFFDLWRDTPASKRSRTVVEVFFRGIQRNALEAAAQLVGDRANMAGQFGHAEIAGRLAQVAYEIKAMIPEIPAQAEEETQCPT